MSLPKDDARWLQRGRQRSAVARALRKPMITSEICTDARAYAPQLQLRDIWHLMRQFQQRGLVTCLNSRMVTGKLYCLTDRGQAAVNAAFGLTFEPPHPSVDWQRYAWVVRAQVRRMVLLEISRTPAGQTTTATEVRKRLREKCPIGLNQTIRALKDLEQLGLVRSGRIASGQVRRTFQIADKGQAIVEQLGRE